MLPSYFHRKLKLIVSLFLCGILFFFVLPVYADNSGTTLNAESMLVNLAGQVPNLMRLVTALAFVMGMIFVIFGLIKLKQYGESRTMMSGDRSLMPSLMFLFVGAMLMFLPSAVQVGLGTFWANPNPYGYLQQQDQWAQFLNDAYLVVQLVGMIAFIRGLVILSQLGGHSQQGNLGRGMAHVIGGLFCINIYQFVQLILNTLGIQS